MYSKEQLKALIAAQFGIEINVNFIGEEAVQFFHEEFDEDIIPKEVLEVLPNPVVIETYSYVDKSEWIVGIALEAESNRPLYLFCLQDDVRVYQEIYTNDPK